MAANTHSTDLTTTDVTVDLPKEIANQAEIIAEENGSKDAHDYLDEMLLEITYYHDGEPIDID